MKRFTKITALLGTLTLVAAACGGSDGSGTSYTETVNDRVRTTQAQASSDGGGRESVPDQVGAETPASGQLYDRAATATTSAPVIASSTNDSDGTSGYRTEDPPTGIFARDYGSNPLVVTVDDPESTFALDVDTGSYTVAKGWIESGQLPDPRLVRIEEFVNYFDQDYPAPITETFAVYADGAPTPFAQSSENYLVRIGIKAREVAEASRPDARLTFVVDVSGSMREGDRLEVVKDALRILVDQLRPTDAVAIVAYNRDAWVVLEPTYVTERYQILDSIDQLHAGGSTNTEVGLTLGYDLSDEVFESGMINRVILLSDGVANVGSTTAGGILERIAERAGTGINLVTVGVGLGNYNDVLLEQLADQGDGFYAYVDSADEAERLFVDDLTGTLLTVAEEAKVQVAFNPNAVNSYRLLGFENRAIADDQFRNDSIDAGEIGAGHEVTALYEVTLTDSAARLGGEDLATVTLRWREPGATSFSEMPGVLPATVLSSSFNDSSAQFQLDVVAAAYAEVLRNSPWAVELNLSWVATEAARVADLLESDEAWAFAELTAEAAWLAGEPVAVLRRP